MTTFLIIYFSIGILCAIIAVVKRHEGELDIKNIRLSALLIAIIWPVILGIHVGEIVKYQLTLRQRNLLRKVSEYGWHCENCYCGNEVDDNASDDHTAYCWSCGKPVRVVYEKDEQPDESDHPPSSS